ncbi:MAG: hypothetical protein WCB92_21915 [Mycobacterium sp.]
MKRSVNVALAACIATSIVVNAGPARLAHADPADPQPGVSCGKSAGVMDGVQTFSPTHEVLQCVKGVPVYVWQHLDDIQRPAVAWFTYGPPAVLNRGDVVVGTKWSGFARGGECGVEQTRIAGGPPVAQTTNGTDTVDFILLPDVATVTLHGVCIWHQVDS